MLRFDEPVFAFLMIVTPSAVEHASMHNRLSRLLPDALLFNQTGDEGVENVRVGDDGVG